MSRSAHARSEYKLRKLPQCSKCNVEFSLVTIQYKDKTEVVEEWECPKCHKVVPKRTLREEPPTLWEKFLHEKCRELNDEQNRTRKRRDRH